MKKNWVLSKELFEALLNWLDPDREQAGLKYEEIREKLIKVLSARGCNEPEDLADEAINRVTEKLRVIDAEYSGERMRYFFAVAYLVFLEHRRKKPLNLPPDHGNPEDRERVYTCLDKCMDHLGLDNKQLILQYYQEQGRVKIEHRRKLAERLNIAPNALRIKIYRMRTALQKCVEECLERTDV
jgi:DNA-directed RNA polymerase specialized sigma24 family protein